MLIITLFITGIATSSISAEENMAGPIYAQISNVQALLKAVAQVNEKGGTIVLEPGTYTITEPVFIKKSDVSIVGSGWNTVIKR
ncbi:MAG: hypothetical protein QME62_08940, partial [Armatimonadota bacterium]|nr:hypothetical protein [Armatimonadota bacterium]